MTEPSLVLRASISDAPTEEASRYITPLTTVGGPRHISFFPMEMLIESL